MAKKAAPQYPTEALLNSKALSGRQRDFTRVLLTRPAYSLEEANAVLDQFFEEGGEA